MSVEGLRPTRLVIDEIAESGWTYSRDGIFRWRPGDEGMIYQAWNGHKWVDRQPEAPRVGVTAEGHSRAVELSALGTDRNPTGSMSGDGFTLYTVDDGELGLGVVEVLILASGRDVWLDETTWERMDDNPYMREKFIADCEQWSAGMKYLMEDVSYARSFKDAKAEEARKRHGATAGVVEVDTIDMLKKRANALIVSAAEYNVAPSALMAENFALRLAEVRTELSELQRRMEEVTDIVGLASTAVMDALTE